LNIEENSEDIFYHFFRIVITVCNPLGVFVTRC